MVETWEMRAVRLREIENNPGGGGIGCEHDSDCATNNAPAYPAGECDCSLSQK